MLVGNYTKNLRDDLRKGLLITLTLLFVCSGVWGQTWVEISDAMNLTTQFNNSGTTYIKLSADITGYGFVVKSGNTVFLDLNGHDIKKNNNGNDNDYIVDAWIIEIKSEAQLTIRDNSDSQTGKIMGGRNRSNTNFGGGIQNLGHLYLENGTITDNSNYGYGGDCRGSGVYNAGDMEMSGGVISNNFGCRYGGGIYNASGATLTITGGSIVNNTSGAGVYNDGTLHISGNPTITGNTGGNVYLPSNKTFDITNGLTGGVGSMGITMQTPGTFTTGATSENDYKIFFSDDNHYEAVAVSIDGDTGNNNVQLKSCWSLLDKKIAEARANAIAKKEKEKGRKLTKEEIAKLESAKLSSGSLVRVRDLFIFGCYSGLAFSDLMDFKPEKLEKEGNETYLYGKRIKTGEEYIVLILPKAQEILEKYGYKLPKYSNQQYNKRLKDVAKEAGVDKPISSHYSRITFGFLALNRGVRIEVVSKAMGHSTISETQRTYSRILKKTVVSEMAKLKE